jgi:mannose-6-phosphate isomerase-like protein (cupin superfamily)
MPIIFDPKDFPVLEKNGINMVTLANRAMLGTDAFQVERITLKAGEKSPTFEPSEKERFVYVIRGNGQAHVEDQSLPLESESVVWLEKGDAFSLEAGSGSLEVILCQAPATE